MSFYTFKGASHGPIDFVVRISNGRGSIGLVRIGPNASRTILINQTPASNANGQDIGPPDIPMFTSAGKKRLYELRFDDLSGFSKPVKIELSITENGQLLNCFDQMSNAVAPKNGFYTLEYDKHGIVHTVDFQVLP